ncbi:MAG: hypothetical protein HY318_09675 [Armatimonadetes bacterium]|nr:hypothetical protein [Armatimonadota bacterium]
MVLTAGFVKARLRATEAFQRLMAAAWVWAEKTVAQWATDVTTYDAKELAVTDAAQDLLKQRGKADARLVKLHDQTVLCLGMARAKYRRNPEILGWLKHLDSESTGRQDTLNDATAWLAAWKKLPQADQATVCTTTIADFTALLTEAETEFKALKDVETLSRKARSEFAHFVGEMWQDCVEWYMVALLVFPEETPEGVNLRATIPTATTEVASTDDSGSTTVPPIPGDDAPSGVTPR